MITLNRKVRFSHPDFTYSGTAYTEYLFGSVGLKVNADVRVEVEWKIEAVNMAFDGTADTVEILDGISSWITEGFRIGDTVTFTGTVSNNVTTTIIDLTDELMSVTAAALTTETVIANAYGETPIVAMDFYPNLIENDTDFSLFNLTDRETKPHYYADTISTNAGSPTSMIVGTNSHGWVSPSDSATIYRSSFTNHIQTFVISHTFTILPIYLAGQLAKLQHGLAPAAGDFLDGESLKYVFTLNAKYIALDPNIPHTSDGNIEFPKGQVGWFNEFINGRPATYTKTSLYYSDLTGKGLTTIDYCNSTNVEAIINSQGTFGNTCVGGANDGNPCNTVAETLACTFAGGVCSVTPTKFIIHVMWLPQNEDVYINTLTDWKTNFIYERAVIVTGQSAGLGENVGDYHFLTNVLATSIDVNQTQLNFTVDFSQVVTDFLDTLDDTDRNFLIFVTVQDSDATAITSIDQTAVIMDVNEMVCDKDDSTLFQIIDDVEFFEYPNCDGCGYSNFNLFPMDTVLVKAQFHVKQGTATDLITLKNISANLIATHENQVDEFPLESFTIDTSVFLPNCDNIQEIEFSQERDFIIPTGDCRNDIRLFRMPTLDIAGYSAYEFIYPFKVRWEEWRQLSGATRCFPTPTQNWRVYANIAGWSVKFSIKAQVEDASTEHTTDFEHITWGTIIDPCDMPYSVEFNTYDTTGMTNYEEVIAADVDTYVEATIKGDFTGFTVDQLYGILTLDAWGVGGVAYSQEIGSRLAVDTDGVWYGTGSTLKATLTKVSDNTLRLSAFINYEYLPDDTDQFILSARIGEFQDCGGSSSGGCMNETTIDTFTCGELQIVAVMDADTLVVSGQVVTSEERDVFVENMILTFLTATTWRIESGGTIDGQFIQFGTTGGTIISAPAHPYAEANVGDTLQGDITGTIGTVLFEDDTCSSACYVLLENGSPVLLEGGGYALLEECT